MDEESSDLTEDSAPTRDIYESDDSESMLKGQRPGESRQAYEARMEQEKEVVRIQKLMKFAFPRQRETHVYRKQLLSPHEDKSNLSISLVQMKKE